MTMRVTTAAGRAAALFLAGAFMCAAAVAQEQTATAKPERASMGVAIERAEGDPPRVKIRAVNPGSPAEVAGIRPDDILLYVKESDGGRTTFPSTGDFVDWITSQPVGSTHDLGLMRGTSLVDAKVTLQLAPPPPPPVARLGLAVKPYAAFAGLEVTAVEPLSWGAKVGFVPGVVLTWARNDKDQWIQLLSPEDLARVEAAQKPGSMVEFAAALSTTTYTSVMVVFGDERAAPVGAPAPDRLAQVITSVNGQNTDVPFVLKANEVIEAQISASAPVAVFMCWEENDPFNVDPPICFKPQGVTAGGGVTYRHRAKEPEKVTLKVESKGASTGTYTIATRNGVAYLYGAETMARLESMAPHAFISEFTSDGLVKKGVTRYRIRDVGKTGALIIQLEDGTRRRVDIERQPSGEVAWSDGKDAGIVLANLTDGVDLYQEGGKTHFSLTADNKFTTGYALVAEYDERDRRNIFGKFAYTRPAAPVAPATEDQVTAMLLDGPARIAALQEKRIADWAFLPQLAGKYWLFVINGVERIGHWEWETRGQTMVAKYWNADSINTTPDPIIRMTHDADVGGINSVATFANKATAQRRIVKGQNGELIDSASDGTPPSILRQLGPNEITVSFNSQYGPVTQVRKALDPMALNTYVERTRVTQQRLAQQRQQQEAARQAAQQQAQQQSDDDAMGSLFGFLGAGAAIVGGADPAQAYLGAITQSVAPDAAPIVQGALGANTGSFSGNVAAGIDNAFASGLNQLAPGVVDAARGANPAVAGLPNAGGVTGGGGAIVRGPNQAAGMCPGFTMENYRTHAFNGGNNQQLFALCGQAYEFYKIHLNAVNQGYGQADANMSWDRHVAVTQQIRAFVQ